jgi:hypothetical protein
MQGPQGKPERRPTRHWKAWVAVLATAVAGMATAVAFAQPASVSQSYKMKMSAQFQMTAKVCDNRGSEIDLSGTLTFGGVGVDVLFENQDSNTTVPGHHSKTASSTASMTLSDFSASSIPKQPVRGGVGGNPWIYVIVHTDNGDSAPMLLGRCVMGNSSKSGKYDGTLNASASALLSALDCSNRGSQVELGTTSGHSGVDATVIFTNNRKFTHATSLDATVDVSLSPAVIVPKAGNLGGVGGNPLISLRFEDDQGAAIGDWYKLGRCVQLNK